MLKMTFINIDKKETELKSEWIVCCQKAAVYFPLERQLALNFQQVKEGLSELHKGEKELNLLFIPGEIYTNKGEETYVKGLSMQATYIIGKIKKTYLLSCLARYGNL